MVLGVMVTVGVPTIAGQTSFDSSYNGNILVNAMTLGLVKKINITFKAAGLNKPDTMLDLKLEEMVFTVQVWPQPALTKKLRRNLLFKLVSIYRKTFT